jgi:hypothetical protein
VTIEGVVQKIQNIYYWAWAGSDRQRKQKSSPGLLFVDARVDNICNDGHTEENESLIFSVNSAYPPLFYTVEVYGDFIPVDEEEGKDVTPTAFDQLLLSVILSPDQIPRDGTALWVTVNNVTQSIFNQQSVDLFIRGRFSAIKTLDEPTQAQASTVATPESNRHSWISDTSPSNSQSRLSWSQRFSSVFTRKSTTRDSLDTPRSVTPPPLMSSTLYPSPSDQGKSPMELYLKQVEELAFSDSEDDSSTVRSESTTTTTRSRSICGAGEVTALEMLRIDIAHSEDVNDASACGNEGNDLNEKELQFSSLLSPEEKEESLDGPSQGQSEGDDGVEGVDAPLEKDSSLPHRLFETFTSSDDGLGIYCSTPCAHCGGCYLDEEILSSWCGLLTERLTTAISPNYGDVLRLHQIPCNICKNLLTPTLHIRQYRVASSREDLKGSCETLWQCDVPYISPLGVRAMTESLIREHGPIVADANWLLVMEPVVYWNQLWYTTRLNLPSGLFQDTISLGADRLTQAEGHQFWQGPVAIGWRESTIQAKIINRCLYKSDELSLSDLFPTITKEESQIAETIMTGLDHTIPAIANVLKTLATLPSLLQSFIGTTSTSKGRQVYLTYLLLLSHFHPQSISKASDLPYGLSKVDFSTHFSHLLADLPLLLSQGSQADKAFIEAISLGFSTNDFEKIQTSHTELMVAATGRASQAIRIALGMLV